MDLAEKEDLLKQREERLQREFERIDEIHAWIVFSNAFDPLMESGSIGYRIPDEVRQRTGDKIRWMIFGLAFRHKCSMCGRWEE